MSWVEIMVMHNKYGRLIQLITGRFRFKILIMSVFLFKVHSLDHIPQSSSWTEMLFLVDKY